MRAFLTSTICLFSLTAGNVSAWAGDRVAFAAPKLSICDKIKRRNWSIGMLCHGGRYSARGLEEVARAAGYIELADWIKELIEADKAERKDENDRKRKDT